MSDKGLRFMGSYDGKARVVTVNEDGHLITQSTFRDTATNEPVELSAVENDKGEYVLQVAVGNIVSVEQKKQVKAIFEASYDGFSSVSYIGEGGRVNGSTPGKAIDVSMYKDLNIIIKNNYSGGNGTHSYKVDCFLTRDENAGFNNSLMNIITESEITKGQTVVHNIENTPTMDIGLIGIKIELQNSGELPSGGEIKFIITGVER